MFRILVMVKNGSSPLGQMGFITGGLRCLWFIANPHGIGPSKQLVKQSKR